MQDRTEARSALQDRIAGILSRTAQLNPVAADEARRLGERDDDSLPSDPSLTHDTALANLVAAFPTAEVVTRRRLDDGRWLNSDTGEITDTFDA